MFLKYISSAFSAAAPLHVYLSQAEKNIKIENDASFTGKIINAIYFKV